MDNIFSQKSSQKLGGFFDFYGVIVIFALIHPLFSWTELVSILNVSHGSNVTCRITLFEIPCISSFKVALANIA